MYIVYAIEIETRCKMKERERERDTDSILLCCIHVYFNIYFAREILKTLSKTLCIGKGQRSILIKKTDFDKTVMRYLYLVIIIIDTFYYLRRSSIKL